MISQMSAAHEDLSLPFEALIIIDAAARIKAKHFNTAVDACPWLRSDDPLRLAEHLEVRILEILGSAFQRSGSSEIVVRDGPRTLRLSQLDGEETLFALVLEIDRNEAKMLRAVSRFQLTRRQSEVLALLLDGSSANDVARTLMISEYTAQGYVKCLLAKTASHNRAEMVAKVLDWTSRPRGRAETDRTTRATRAV